MLQFSIRDLLWLTVVVAFSVLWWGEVRQRRLDGAELWAKNLQLTQDFTNAISLLTEEYQDRFRCDAFAARARAEEQVIRCSRQQRTR